MTSNLRIKCGLPMPKPRATDAKCDVLHRLDNLVSGGPSKQSTPKGILKSSSRIESKNKRRIYFPKEDRELFKVIGYSGGDDLLYSSSDDDDNVGPRHSTKSFSADRQEAESTVMSIEEQEIRNITRKNTTFNSHAPNLSQDPSLIPPPIGAEKRSLSDAPIITVRPFVCQSNSMNSPVISKGKFIKNSKYFINNTKEQSNEVDDDEDNDEDEGDLPLYVGRHRIREDCAKNLVKNDSLGSDGANTDTASSSSSGGETPPPPLTLDDEKQHQHDIKSSNCEQTISKAKQSASEASARLSFLNSTILFDENSSMPENNLEKTESHVISSHFEKIADSPSIKANQKYRSGSTSLSVSTSIIKGTPRPNIIKRTNVKNEKPKLPKKPMHLIIEAQMRREGLRNNTENKDNLTDEKIMECSESRFDTQNLVTLELVTEKPVTPTSTSSPEPCTFNETSIIDEIIVDSSIQSNEYAEISTGTIENLENNQDDLVVNKEVNKMDKKLKVSSSFEDNRASIANALDFHRHDIVNRPSIKKQTSKSPTYDDEKLVKENDSHSSRSSPIGEDDNSVKILVDSAVSVQEVELKKPLRQSSLKCVTEEKREMKNHVQFSPDLSTSQDGIKPISYNKWLGRNGALFESSFTGQPIPVQKSGSSSQIKIIPQKRLPNSASSFTSSSMNNINYDLQQLPSLLEADEVRRWTEKKRNGRAKSVPKFASEIDDLIGSSKIIHTPKLFSRASLIQGSGHASPIRRQSRVEIYEAEKKQRKNGKFSFKNILKLGSAHLTAVIPTQTITAKIESEKFKGNNFLDEEHEREILEREKNRIHRRPQILHTLNDDTDDQQINVCSVEMIKIAPNSNNQRSTAAEERVINNVYNSGIQSFDFEPVTNEIVVYSKKETETKFNGGQCVVDVHSHHETDINKPKTEAFDSGHETSSIHTDNSEGNSVTSSSSVISSSSFFVESNHSRDISDISLTSQINDGSSWKKNHQPSDYAHIRSIGVNSAGRPKPIPPPRIHSLDGSSVVSSVTSNYKPLNGTKYHNVYSNTGGDNISSSKSPYHHGSPPRSTKEGPHYASSPIINYLNKNETSAIVADPIHQINEKSVTFVTNTKIPDIMNLKGDLRNLSEMDSSRLKMNENQEKMLSSGANTTTNTSREHHPSVTSSTETSVSSCSNCDNHQCNPGRQNENVNITGPVLNVANSNYGGSSTIVTANQEALRQILRQVRLNASAKSNHFSSTTKNEVKKGLSLKEFNFSDCEIVHCKDENFILVRTTYKEKDSRVTLIMSEKSYNSGGVQGSFNEEVDVVEFYDNAVPAHLFNTHVAKQQNSEKIKAFVQVFFHKNDEKIVTLGDFVQRTQASQTVNVDKEAANTLYVCFQLITGLQRLLQANIHTVNDDFVKLVVEIDQLHPKLIMIKAPNSEQQSIRTQDVDLCQLAHTYLQHLLVASSESLISGQILAMLELGREHPDQTNVVLERVKCLLEFMLWGPTDITDKCYQTWLDIKRAMVLKDTMSSGSALCQIKLSQYDEHRLNFMISTHCKRLSDASLILSKVEKTTK